MSIMVSSSLQLQLPRGMSENLHVLLVAYLYLFWMGKNIFGMRRLLFLKAYINTHAWRGKNISSKAFFSVAFGQYVVP